jgi:hypothetical protein
MSSELLERRFAAMGARLKVAEGPWRGEPRIDIRVDARGEYFDLRFAAGDRGVERPPETRGAAGSIPAGHTSGSVAQPAELPALTRDGAGSTPAGAILGRTATGAVPRLENGRAFGPWGFDSLSFRFVEAWPSWKGSALLARRRPRAARRFESCCLRHSSRFWL